MSIHDVHSMRNKKQICCLILGITFAAAAVIFYFMEPWYATVAIPAIFFIIIPLAVMPYKITFDEEGFTLQYLMAKNERYLWSNIESMEAEFHGNGSYMYVPYEKAPREEKRLKQYKFPKTRKSEVALGLYYTGKIEDEQRDGIPWR